MGTLELGLLKCDCGRPAKSLCGTNKECTLVACMKPVCGEDGGRESNCTHRHANGTMGYPHWRPVTARWEGYGADGPGFFENVRALWLTWTMTAKQAAQRAWDDARKQFPVPAPLPPFRIIVRNRVFEAEGEVIHEIFGPKGWAKQLAEETKREEN